MSNSVIEVRLLVNGVDCSEHHFRESGVTEDGIGDGLSSSSEGNKIGALLSEDSSFSAHDMSTDKAIGFSLEDEFADAIRLAAGKSLAIGAIEAFTHLDIDTLLLGASSVRPTIPHSGSVKRAAGMTSKRISSLTPSMALRARLP